MNFTHAPHHQIAFRRSQLLRLLTTHTPFDAAVLLMLALRADMRSGQARIELETLATCLAAPQILVRAALQRLHDHDALEIVGEPTPTALVIDLGPALVLDASAPSVLPIERV